MKRIKVLVACEFSGVVRDAFIAKGHDAWSCDLLPSDNPGNHIQGDVLELLKFINKPVGTPLVPSKYPAGLPSRFDLMISHPPCKYICNGGNNWLNRRPDLNWRENRKLGADFFMKFINAPVDKIAVENPIGCMSTLYRKPDQIIHPYMFGHPVRKDTCLWLKNLPKLQSTEFIGPPYKKWDFWSTKRHPDGRDVKAITFQGIANAMAEQWGSL
jgi:hypothetical protein